MLSSFLQRESEVRSYCRNFPILLDRSKGSYVYASDGRAFLDFLAGAGALNYGHNDPLIKQSVIDYLIRDGVVSALDLHTVAKRDFIDAFCRFILGPRNLDYKLQFTSPSGTSVIESAVKLARKVTGRSNVVAFTNAFHGMSGAALSLTGNRHHRQPFQMAGVTRLPYDGYLGRNVDTVEYFRRLLDDPSSGVDLPAAVVLETVQGEGGVNVASGAWLRALRDLTSEHEILLVIDDIQAGCGRSGGFFSFEEAGIQPDLACLSKSLSGIGVPFALLLIHPSYDRWSPGEDNGTFRGNNLAFIAATAAIEHYWANGTVERNVAARSAQARECLLTLKARHAADIADVRGRGLLLGVEFVRPEAAAEVSRACFERGLIIETCGARDHVLKLMPALTIGEAELQTGLDVIADAVDDCISTPRYAYARSAHRDGAAVAAYDA